VPPAVGTEMGKDDQHAAGTGGETGERGRPDPRTRIRADQRDVLVVCCFLCPLGGEAERTGPADASCRPGRMPLAACCVPAVAAGQAGSPPAGG